jgi:hypothetical protein
MFINNKTGYAHIFILNEIFSGEKCPKGLYSVVECPRFDFLIYSFLNEIFSAEKCSNGFISQGLDGKV